eukprot:jgi/Botrbrau1/16332/Bobra.0066s0098.1
MFVRTMSRAVSLERLHSCPPQTPCRVLLRKCGVLLPLKRQYTTRWCTPLLLLHARCGGQAWSENRLNRLLRNPAPQRLSPGILRTGTGYLTSLPLPLLRSRFHGYACLSTAIADDWKTGDYTPVANDETPLIPDPPRARKGARLMTAVGVDPDINGAAAVVQARVSEEGVLQSAVVVACFDMPTDSIKIGSRIKRQTNAEGVVELLQNIVGQHGRGIKVVLEQPVPNMLNGKQSWMGVGFAFGVWRGALASHHLQVSVVSARRWKIDLQLEKLGKEGSRQLALSLFPAAAPHLKRKKDHGRAEAILIASWGLGLQHPEALPALTLALQPLLKPPLGASHPVGAIPSGLTEGSMPEDALMTANGSEETLGEGGAADGRSRRGEALGERRTEETLRDRSPEETLGAPRVPEQTLMGLDADEETLPLRMSEHQLSSFEVSTGSCDAVPPKPKPSRRKKFLAPLEKPVVSSSDPESTLAAVKKTLASPAGSQQTLAMPAGFFQTLAMSRGSRQTLSTQSGRGQAPETLGGAEAVSTKAGYNEAQNPTAAVADAGKPTAAESPLASSERNPKWMDKICSRPLGTRGTGGSSGCVFEVSNPPKGLLRSSRVLSVDGDGITDGTSGAALSVENSTIASNGCTAGTQTDCTAGISGRQNGACTGFADTDGHGLKIQVDHRPPGGPAGGTGGSGLSGSFFRGIPPQQQSS